MFKDKITISRWIILIGLASFISMNFSSCKKGDCKNSDVKTLLLDKSQVSSLFYQGIDTSVFVSETDTFTYISNSKSQYFIMVNDPAVCDGIGKKLEGAQIILNTKLSDKTITHLQLVPVDNEKSSTIQIVYQNVNFWFDYGKLKKPWALESKEIGGKTYHNVYLSITPGKDSLYYNMENGIIRISLPRQGTYLELI
jgi:hypothetical protein